LDTNPWRVQAVAAYLRLGFEPWPRGPEGEQLWKSTLEALERWRAGRATQ
jgi:hypothetical protein